MSDFDNCLSGPADLLLDDDAMGHTEGGIEVTITPNNRARNVDQFGSGECAMIHLGDEVRVMAPLAEWTAATMGAVYAAGRDQLAAVSGSKYLGIGRSAGFIYPALDLKVIPLLSADDGKRFQFWRSCPVGALTLTFDNADNDRIFESEFACLIDESKTDGELIGRMQLTHVDP